MLNINEFFSEEQLEVLKNVYVIVENYMYPLIRDDKHPTKDTFIAIDLDDPDSVIYTVKDFDNQNEEFFAVNTIIIYKDDMPNEIVTMIEEALEEND